MKINVRMKINHQFNISDIAAGIIQAPQFRIKITNTGLGRITEVFLLKLVEKSNYQISNRDDETRRDDPRTENCYSYSGDHFAFSKNIIQILNAYMWKLLAKFKFLRFLKIILN